MSAGAERIIEHILNDAREKAAEIRAEAEKRSREIMALAQEEASRRRERILARARDEAAELKRRILGGARLEARKEKLAAKQELIAEAFRQALEELCSLDDESYCSLLREMLLAAVEKGTEKVFLSERDRARIPESFWAELNAALEQAGKEGKLAPAEEARDIKGGFILQWGGVEINCSFEALLEAQREELEPEVAGILFG
ncbi:MAG TPA: V-type ATP synthase subunit E [Bacillota bacterium]|nr:V-type ATP synthase subunit E [Bacillota bacterium]